MARLLVPQRLLLGGGAALPHDHSVLRGTAYVVNLASKPFELLEVQRGSQFAAMSGEMDHDGAETPPPHPPTATAPARPYNGLVAVLVTRLERANCR